MIKCKLTGNEGKAVKAHIIPKSFYEFKLFDNEPYHVIGSDPNIKSKRSPMGLYDKTILTAEGESCFLNYDNYAYQLLFNDFFQFQKIIDQGQLIGYKKDAYDYSALKLFCLSVLWRGHHSSNEFFSKIKLGPHEEVIKKMILTGNAKKADDYSVFITKWKEEESFHIFLDPHKFKIEGISYYRIYLGKFFITIKVDKRESLGVIRKVQLSDKESLKIVCQKQNKSKAFVLMEKIGTKHFSKE
ncbi:MAG: hypothetical protein NE328_02620 [Lentisphaeraceae bacterium]|nr:hypothetical protein [Lentisphaeraceae bacterium]